MTHLLVMVQCKTDMLTNLAVLANFPSPGLTGRIVVYGGTGGGGPDTYTLSDGSSLTSAQSYDTAPYYEGLDFGEKKNITSLVCSPGYTIYAISVDGVFMKDSTTETLSFGTNGYYLPMDGRFNCLIIEMEMTLHQTINLRAPIP